MRKILLLTLSVFMLYTFSTCIKPGASKPKASVQFKNIKKISLIKKYMTLGMMLNIYNPWPVGGSVRYVKMKFLIENKQLAKVKFKNPRIKASGTANNPFDLNLKFKDLYRIYKDYRKRDRVRYTVRGTVGIKLPIYGIFKLPFSHSGTLPTIRVSFKVKKFKVGKVRLTMTDSNPRPGISLGGIGKALKKGRLPQPTVDVSFNLIVTNKTKAILKFANFKHQFNLGGYNILNGSTGKPISSTNNRFVYRVTNRIKLISSARAVFSRNRSNYKWSGTVTLQLPAPFGNVPVKFRKKGKLSW